MAVIRLMIILLAAITFVICDEESDEQKKINQEIADMICNEEDRPKSFYKCIMCCQGNY